VVVRRRRWWHWPRRFALVIAAPFLLVLFLVSLPIVLPFVGIAQVRSEKRKRACVERWPCGWCVAPLGGEALVRADALFGAYVDRQFGDDFTFRIVRDLHACCLRCDAGHRYDEQADRLVLLHSREFATMYPGTRPRGVAHDRADRPHRLYGGRFRPTARGDADRTARCGWYRDWRSAAAVTMAANPGQRHSLGRRRRGGEPGVRPAIRHPIRPLLRA
jgi:hypothetical protein